MKNIYIKPAVLAAEFISDDSLMRGSGNLTEGTGTVTDKEDLNGGVTVGADQRQSTNFPWSSK